MIEIFHTSLAYFAVFWVFHHVAGTILTVQIGGKVIGNFPFKLLSFLLIIWSHHFNYSIYWVNEGNNKGEYDLNEICNWKENYECNSGWKSGEIWLYTKIEGNYLENRNYIGNNLSCTWFMCEWVCFCVWIHNITYKKIIITRTITINNIS